MRFRFSVVFCFCAMILASCGCGLRKPKSVIPVVGPPPPRTSLVNNSPSTPMLHANGERVQPGDSSLVNVSVTIPADSQFSETQTVAYINGEPLLAGEILEPYSAKLEEFREKVPPAQFSEIRNQLLQRDLETHIDNKLLIQAFKSTLKKEQEEMLGNAVTQLFNTEVERMKAQFGVNTDYELELELQKQGTTLASLQKAFGNRVMAAEFLKSKSANPPAPSRVELLNEYERVKQDKYFKPARVRWEQILISYGANGGKEGAMKKLLLAATDLRNGVDFAEVAKKYSDGPGAKQGGYWDWMQENSLADREIERALFTMPVGRVSDVFVGESDYQLVRVLERESPHYVPFEDVQDEIKESFTSTFRKQAAEQAMKELRDSATIQTIFDQPQVVSTPRSNASIAPVAGTEAPFQPQSEAPITRQADAEEPFVPLSRQLPLD